MILGKKNRIDMSHQTDVQKLIKIPHLTYYRIPQFGVIVYLFIYMLPFICPSIF